MATKSNRRVQAEFNVGKSQFKIEKRDNEFWLFQFSATPFRHWLRIGVYDSIQEARIAAGSK